MWYFVNKGTSSNNHDDDEEDFNCGVRRGGNKGGRGCKSGEEDAAIDVLNELDTSTTTCHHVVLVLILVVGEVLLEE